MSTVPVTPRHARQPSASVHVATPASRVPSGSMVHASPHYQTTRRHSLYGTEDRVVIDPGSRIWKVGFSGEGRPRDVFLVDSLWGLSRAAEIADREEEDRLLEIYVRAQLRSVFHDILLTDPKSRKVILVEHPLLPVYVKDTFARVLFGNMQVPSISFAPSHLLSLLSVGRITGLVLDCGNLESTALPIFSARPLFPQLRTTPLAGARLTAHLRALLLLFGTYLPPPTSLSGSASIPAATRSTRVPQEVLTDAVIEDIKTRCCFVGDPLDASADMQILGTPSEDPMDLDLPPSERAPSESDFSRVSHDLDSTAASSGFSVVSRSQVGLARNESHLEALANMYKRHSTATDLQLKVTPPATQQTGTGLGTLVIPGWVRERGAEVLFEGGDIDETSVAETILDSLLKVPVDLRRTLACSILITGGTAMLPGFIQRLHSELLRAIASSASSAGRPPMRPDRPRPPAYDRYAVLRPLVPHLAVLNNPSPPPPTGTRGNAQTGKAPAFAPATMPWVGGSLAGSLKTGGVELSREKWDEAAEEERQSAREDASEDMQRRVIRNVLPDWTRMPLPSGAPPVTRAPAPVHIPETAAVGA
ncbi:actin family [Vararia minispora EC-137]|uniref:Actin family n=1 Tax=Vararia minispora EC-137 TaxID=1314806 RepID=A0ACB8QSX4_9AGAM|nr:actin family [Vararia minispora EC-137]